MDYISVASGIEAATVAWHPLGWSPLLFAQHDPDHKYKGGPDFPSAVLAHHYPHVPNLGDMTKFKDWPDVRPNVLVGGTPCQSFSVAGLRKGLADPRGNLALTYLTILDRYRPEWCVWENVPGVLSIDEGRAFGSILGGLAELGYGFSYRVLDAQYVRVDGFGRAVPQRRRRVFVVGNSRDWRRAAAVLFERESLSWNTPPRRETGKGFAADIAPSIVSSGRGVERTGDTRGQDPVIAVASTLDASYARLQGCSGQDLNHGHSHLIPFGGNNTAGPINVATAVNAHGGPAGRLDFESETFVAFDTTQITSKTNRCNPQPGDACHPLAAGAHAPAIAFDCKASGQSGFGVGEVASTMRAMGHSDSHQNGGGHQAVAVGWAVRRLTPRECERLQGFPDGYTDVPWRNKNWTPDGPRYKALGNSMAVNVMRWLGTRIQLVSDIAKSEAA